MNKRILQTLLLFSLLIMAGTSNAQVTIGSGIAPSRAALLDIKTRQASGIVNTVGDDENITSTVGGVLLPRVKLLSTNTLQPFVEIAEDDWTDPDKQKALRLSLAGLIVYNISTVGASLYPGLYTWDGQKWATSQANPSAGIEIGTQPKSFSFYEQGTETAQALTLSLSGLNVGDVVTYQWYEVIGKNVHVPVGVALAGSPHEGNGSKTASYTPAHIIKGTTRNANNAGFYRFYCIATDGYGKQFMSAIAEVAVGCGAKNNLGEWHSFMCFNLGADNNSTIQSQKDYPIGTYTNDPATGFHDHIPGEENLWGSYFQWGRIADGHENGQSSTIPFANISPADITSGSKCYISDTSRPDSQISKTSSAYGKFIAIPNDPYNWNPKLPSALWRAGRFVQNDPCAHYKEDATYHEFWNEDVGNNSPACSDVGTGWMAPSQAEWGNIYRGGTLSGNSDTASANTWSWYGGASLVINMSRGYEIKPDGSTTTLFLPANGYRTVDAGRKTYQGGNGYYWSSTQTVANASNLDFYNPNINPNSENTRGQGFGVRCVKAQ